MKPLILASQSPRRKKLLKQIGMKFRVIPSHAAEVFSAHQSPGENAQRIALEKAADVAAHVRKGIVIGADTIVVLDQHVLGKPKSKDDAKRMLRLLSGREHSVFTGFALKDAETGKHTAGVEETKVRFRKLTEKEISDYVNSGSLMDKAGSYGIQDDFGAVFVERINGCFYNVVGFPLARFYSTLQRFSDEGEQFQEKGK
ncbi:MAG: septum formation protein Maf [Ignavibacteriae bacterium]|nr:MAG: septum formation protein Maf [Ignavibacteriota bacterium]